MIQVEHNPARGWRPYSVTFAADGGTAELWFHTIDDVVAVVRRVLAAEAAPTKQAETWTRRRAAERAGRT